MVPESDGISDASTPVTREPKPRPAHTSLVSPPKKQNADISRICKSVPIPTAVINGHYIAARAT